MIKLIWDRNKKCLANHGGWLLLHSFVTITNMFVAVWDHMMMGGHEKDHGQSASQSFGNGNSQN